jgi:RND family efflux transporter MFP subunit
MNIKRKQQEESIFKFSNLRIGTFFFIITSILFTSCKQETGQSSQSKAKKTPLVQVQPAQKSKMVSILEITGTIEANVFTEVKSPADGVIELLNVRENQHAQKGEIIAVINPEDRLALTAENKLKIEQLEKQLKTEDKESKAYDKLLKELQEAKEDLKYAQDMYQTIPVICPMTGLVTSRWLDKGSQVSANEKLITITDMSSLVVKTEVNEKYFEAVKQDRQFPVFLNAYHNDTITGRISLVYPQIDPETRSVKFDIRLLNFNKKILPGMMAVIKVPVSVKENAIVIPNHAVLTSPDNKNFLFIVDKDSIAHRHFVETGITSGNQLEIIKGLKENVRVVVSGQEMLKDSIKVKIMGTPKGGGK